jgi:hypothetical protein
MHALLLMPAYVLAHLAAIEPARRHVRSRRRRQLSCAPSSRDAPFVFPRRGRRGVSCPRSLHDPSFDVRALEARGCAFCFSLHGVHDLSIASAFGSRRSPFTLRGRAHVRLATTMTASTSCERSSAFPPRSRPLGPFRSQRPRSTSLIRRSAPRCPRLATELRSPVSTPVPALGGAMPPELISRRSFRDGLATITALRRRLTVHGLAIRAHVSAVRLATLFRWSQSVTT